MPRSTGTSLSRTLTTGRPAALLLALLALVMTGCHGKKVRIGENGEVYYKGKATREEARKVGALLQSRGVFEGGRRKSLQLRKKGGVYQLRVVIIKGKEADKEILQSLKFTTGLISHQVLDGAKITLHLCDKYFKTLKRFEIPASLGDLGRRMMFGKGELWIKESVKDGVAKKIGEALKGSKFFSDKRTTSAAVAKEDGTYHLRLVMKEDAINAKQRKLITHLGFGISLKALDGAPLKVHFCNTAVEPFEALPVLYPGKRVPFGMGAVFYAKPVTAEEAARLGKDLQALQFFNARRAVRMGKKGTRFQLRFVAKAGMEGDASLQQALANMVKKIEWLPPDQVDLFTSDAYFGSPTPFKVP